MCACLHRHMGKDAGYVEAAGCAGDRRRCYWRHNALRLYMMLLPTTMRHTVGSATSFGMRTRYEPSVIPVSYAATMASASARSRG